MSTSPVGRSHRAAMTETLDRDPAYLAALQRLMPYEQIAREVIALRMELGVSQEELARKVGTSASAIARLERGNHRPSVETLRRVAEAMDRELVIEFHKSPTPSSARSDEARPERALDRARTGAGLAR